MPFGNSWQSFDFQEGMNLIIGKTSGSSGSNASGKSSIFDVIIFGLYGKVTKDINKDQIPNWKNKKNCEVKIHFKKGQDSYMIHRGLGPNILKLYKNGQENEQISHNREFQEEIESQVLGIDYNTFLSIAHYNATQSTSIFNVSKGTKRAFLEKLFGLQIYTDLLVKCNNKLASINIKLTNVQNEISFQNRQIKEYKDQIDNFSNDINNLSYFTNDSKIVDFEEKRKNLEEIKNKFDRVFEDNTLEKKKYSSDLEQVDNTIESLKKKIFELRCKNDSISIKYVTFDKNEYIKLKETLDKVSKELENLDLEVLENSKQELETKVKSLKQEIEKIDLENAELDGKISSIHIHNLVDGHCPICNSKVKPNQITNFAKEKKESFETQIKKNKESKLEFVQQVKELKEEIEEIKISINKIKTLELKKPLLIEKIKNLEKDKDSLDELEQKKKDKKKFELFIKKFENEIQEETIAKNSLLDKINELNKFFSDYEEVTSNLEKINNELSLIYSQKEGNDSKIILLKQLINDNENKIEDGKNVLKDLDKQEIKSKNIIDYLEFIRKITKDEEVRNYVIQNSIPFLTKKVNEYLSNAGCSFYLKLDTMLNAEIKGPGITNASFGSLSSGQQKVTNVAMLLAFLDLFKLRSPVTTNILLLDEILDSAVDSITLTQLMRIIQEKQKEENLKCYLITHRKEISEIAQFDSIARVENVDGFSHLHMVNE